MLKFLMFIPFAYLMGALPNGVIIGKKFKNIDIREHGSGNSGATNAYRILGPKYGIGVLMADLLKGFIPVMLADIAGVNGNYVVVLGLITIVGHTFSIFLNFKGGKGVATSLGVFLYLLPNVVGLLVLIFAGVVYMTRYVSLGSMIASGMLPILTFFMPIRQGLDKVPLMILTTIIGVFVIYKHSSNITKLKNGTESKFKFK